MTCGFAPQPLCNSRGTKMCSRELDNREKRTSDGEVPVFSIIGLVALAISGVGILASELWS